MIGEILAWLGINNLGRLSEVNRTFSALIRHRYPRSFRGDFKKIRETSHMVWALKHGLDLFKVTWHLTNEKKWDTLIELFKQGFKCMPRVVCMAAYDGNLEVVKEMFANGASVNGAIVTDAGQCGHFHIIDWLVENGRADLNQPIYLRMARQMKWDDFRDWLIAKGCPEE